MDLNIQIVEGDLEQKWIVFYDWGKINTPLFMITCYEFDRLIEKYEKMKNANNS